MNWGYGMESTKQVQPRNGIIVIEGRFGSGWREFIWGWQNSC